MARSSYVTLIVAMATSAALATAVAIVSAQAPAIPKIDSTSTTKSVPSETVTPMQDAAEFVGVSSCAASGCHGGSKPTPGTAATEQPAWRSSYIVWATADPHARAYQTLKTPAAEAIVRKLARLSAEQDTTAVIELRCVSCHATTPKHFNSPPPAEIARLRSVRADGIGCESCHGGAKRWLGEHFLVRTDGSATVPDDVAKNEKTRLSELGMLDTDNLAVQAAACVRCHVGERGLDGEHDMNHDMIAAGHPALNFEFAAYKARMPRHWAVPQDPAARADREVRTWIVGQLTTAAAALRLSELRFFDSLSVKPAVPNAPWPEFSEYACYRCHHALRSGATADPTAQQNHALERKQTSSLAFGNQLWSTWLTWHTSQALALKQPPVADELRKLIVDHADPQHPLWAEDRNDGDPDYAASLEQAAATVAAAPIDLSARQLVDSLADIAKGAAASSLSWDEATQAYLGCVAMYRARRMASDLPLDRIDDEPGRVLKQLYAALRFDQPGERRFNSPANYDRALVKSLFEKLAASVREGG